MVPCEWTSCRSKCAKSSATSSSSHSSHPRKNEALRQKHANPTFGERPPFEALEKVGEWRSRGSLSVLRDPSSGRQTRGAQRQPHRSRRNRWFRPLDTDLAADGVARMRGGCMCDEGGTNVGSWLWRV